MTGLLTPTNLRLVRLELRGLDEYVDNIIRAGRDIEEVVSKAIEESAKVIYEDMQKWAEKHKLTGAVLEGVGLSNIGKEGNNIFMMIGIDTYENSNSWHAVFVEYGSPTQPADPGIRNAFDNNKSKIKRIQRQILAQGGVPVE